MDINPNNHNNYNLIDIVVMIFNFLAKNLLGILSIMFGVVTKVYIIRKEYKRIGKWQCRLSVFISGLAGTIAYITIADTSISHIQKAVIIGFMPVIIEPIFLRILIWINPIIDAIGELFKSKIKKQE